MKSCLNCRYQPNWDAPQQHGDYSLRMGDCKFKVPAVKLPACVANHISLQKRRITRYSDDSGVYTRCQTWDAPQEIKDEKQASA